MINGELERNFQHLEKPGQSEQVIRLEASKSEVLAHALSRAFYAEPRITYAIPDETERRAVLPWFLNSAIRAAHFYGESYTTRAIDGGALWIGPGRTLNIRRIMRNGLLS